MLECVYMSWKQQQQLQQKQQLKRKKMKHDTLKVSQLDARGVQNILAYFFWAIVAHNIQYMCNININNKKGEVSILNID